MSENDAHERIQAETERLFEALLAKAHHILKAGTTQNQIALIRQVIPVLMKEMADSKSKEENVEQQKALDDLFAQARKSFEK